MSEILVIIRPSFMKFCEDGCRAALFNHLLYWIGKKVQIGETTYFATTEDLTKDMAGSWGSKKIRLEVNALVDMGLIERGKNPKWGVDRTKHFSFGKDQYDKLVELCKKHKICLAHIGLSKEIINLLRPFGESVECPCTGQMVNLPNANGQMTKCSEHGQMVKSPLANGKKTTTITQNSTQISNTQISNERTNGARQSNVSASDSSSIHPSNFSSSFSSQEKPAIEFSPEAERIYGFAEKLKLARLKRNETNRDYCEILAKEITTQEQMDSLAAYSREKLKHKGKVELYLGNLATDLNGWSQVQEQTKKSTVSNEEVTDSDIADMVETWSRLYKDTEHIKENQARVKQIQNECRMSNSKFFDTLFKAKDDTDYSGDISMRSFFRMLNRQLGRNPVTVGNRHLQPLSSRPRLQPCQRDETRG